MVTAAVRPSSLAQVLFGKTRRSILSLLLCNPERSFHLRDLARQTRCGVGPIQREVEKLVRCGLLVKRRQGVQVSIQADGACPVFPELRSLFRKTSGMADVVRAALAPLAADIDVAIIFGSVAAGAERSGSDVDVLVVGRASFGDVIEALVGAQEELGRDLNPVVMDVAELRRRVRGADGFVMELLSSPKIYLMGGRDDLARLAGQPVVG